MKKFYLFSFSGGANGDFLCSRIAQLDGFHNPGSDSNGNTTEYCLSFDSDLKLKVAFAENHLVLPDDRINCIKDILQSHSIIAPTHYQLSPDVSNIPNMVPVRAQGFHKLTPLFYTLLWIKRWTTVWNCTETSEIVKNDPHSVLNTADLKKLKKTISYNYERPMLVRRYTTTEEFIKGFYRNEYLPSTVRIVPGWRTVNLDTLFLYPNLYMNDFSKQFDVQTALDPRVVEIYHHQNLQLIEKTFNQSPDIFFQGDWLNKLTHWVREKCPYGY